MRRPTRSVLLSRPELLPVLLPHLLAVAAHQRYPSPQAADAQLEKQPGAGHRRREQRGGRHRCCSDWCGRHCLAALRIATCNVFLVIRLYI
nr:unnamed protein product [Callosobruchus analis]